MNFKLILTKKNNNIFNIILNDQENQNTLSENMINELTLALDIADKDNDIKVIILSSKGNIFCAGHNLKDLNLQRLQNDKGESYFKKIFQMCSHLMLKINKNNKPVIAMVDGIATAAGCQLISSCDLAYSSSRAKYATPGVNIGLFCSTPMVPLSRTVGKKQAMEMLLTGDLIDANKALRIGLINDVFEEDSLKENVFQIAKKISSKSSNTIKIGKEAFYKQKDMNLEDAYTFTSKVMTENMLHDDSKEGIEAFLEKNFDVYLSEDFIEAKEILSFVFFDLIILDRMMPSGDGIDLIKFIKENSSSPVIMLTALDQDKNKIQGLKLGADDYVSKPFEPEELYLRIIKLLKLYENFSNQDIKITFGSFTYDISTLELKRNNELVYLTESENDLMIRLIDKRNDIVLREELADQEFDESELRKVDVRITRLRQKIEKNAKQPQFIKTIRGKGYKLICDEL